MGHILFFLYIFLLAAGSTGTAAVGLLHHRFRKPLTRYMVWVNAALLGALFLNIISYYTEALMALPQLAVGFRYTLSLLCGFMIYGGIALAAAQLPGVRRLPLFLAALGVALIIVVRLGLVLRGSAAQITLFRFPSTLLISLYLFYLGFLLFRFSPPLQEETLDRLVRRLGAFTLIFAVGSTLFYFFRPRIPVLAEIPISLDYLFYFVWSLISLSGLLGYLKRPAIIDEQRGLSPAFLRQYSLTPREEEIITIIGRGKSNQEIADELGVSFTTVRTHVYNIFRKTGVKNRGELIRLAGGFRE